jgi:hypothetical protein
MLTPCTDGGLAHYWLGSESDVQRVPGTAQRRLAYRCSFCGIERTFPYPNTTKGDSTPMTAPLHCGRDEAPAYATPENLDRLAWLAMDAAHDQALTMAQANPPSVIVTGAVRAALAYLLTQGLIEPTDPTVIDVVMGGAYLPSGLPGVLPPLRDAI